MALVRYQRIAAVVALTMAACCGALLVSGRGILVAELKVEPGERVNVEGYGDISSASQATLVCRYFSGRSVLPKVYWYSPNGYLGKPQCPFLVALDQ